MIYSVLARKNSNWKFYNWTAKCLSWRMEEWTIQKAHLGKKQLPITSWPSRTLRLSLLFKPPLDYLNQPGSPCDQSKHWDFPTILMLSKVSNDHHINWLYNIIYSRGLWHNRYINKLKSINAFFARKSMWITCELYTTVSSWGITRDVVQTLVLKHINCMPRINSKFEKLMKEKIKQITKYVDGKH